MTVTVTGHAIERYLERIDGSLTWDQARAAILASEKAIQKAAEFGASVVRNGLGAKLVLDGETVVTVLRRRDMSRCQFPQGKAA